MPLAFFTFDSSAARLDQISHWQVDMIHVAAGVEGTVLRVSMVNGEVVWFGQPATDRDGRAAETALIEFIGRAGR